MKRAFSRSTRSEAERDELFATYSAAGFAGLQLKSNQYADYLRTPESFLDRWGQRPGLTSGLIHGGALDAAGEVELRRVIAFGAAVGAERVIFWPRDPRSTQTDLAGFARRLGAIGAEAQAAGVRLSLHHHDNQIVMTREEITEVFQIVGTGPLGLTIDTAHLVKSGMPDVAAIIHTFAPVIDNFHLKDFGNGTWQILGQGEMDFAPIFAAIRAIGFAGWVCADEESGGDFTAALTTSAAMLTAGMEPTAELATRP